MDVKTHLNNSLGDHKPMRDVSKDRFVRKKQWPYDGAPTIVYEQSNGVFIRIEDNTDYKANQVFQESPLDLSIRKDHYSEVPVRSFSSDPEIQQTVITGSTHNQQPSYAQTQPTNDPQVYDDDGVDIRTKQIEQDIQQSCPDVEQKVNIDPLCELQPVQQANLKLPTSNDTNELQSEVVMTPEQPQRTPLKQLMITPNAENLGTQQAHDSLAIAVPSTSYPCYEPVSPYDAAEPPPELTSGENISSAQLTTDLDDTSEPSLATNIPSTSYAQVPSFDIAGQAATQSDPASPTVQDIDASERHVEVRDINPVDASQAEATEKPISMRKNRKPPISYGTGFHCKICDQEFGKPGSLLQHLRVQHQETRPFRCDVCGKSYRTEPDMLKHRQNHDPSMKPYKCQDCEKTYRHLKDRDRHFAMHHGTPTYVCSIEGCLKPFVRNDHFLAHYKSHQNRSERKKRIEIENKLKELRRAPQKN
nr:zinc finger protein 236-like [Aedes albopictus]XP_029710308.1 zinc finger protein 236-like [Aedes albopictus]